MARLGLPWLIDWVPGISDGQGSARGPALEDPVRVARSIASVATSVASESDPARVAAAIVGETLKLGAHVTMLFAADETRRRLRLIAHANVPERLLRRFATVSYDNAMASTRAALTHHVQTAPWPDRYGAIDSLARELLDASGSRSVVAVPLLAQHRLVGVLTWSLRHEHGFSGSELEAVMSLGSVFALGLENARRADSEHRLRLELDRSERKYRSVFNSSVELIVVLDPGGRVMDANHTALAVTGVRLDDVAGRPLDQTRWWQMVESNRGEVQRAIELAGRGQPAHFSVSLTVPGGGLEHFDVIARPVLGTDGRTELIVIEGRPITAERRIEEERRVMVDRLESQRRRFETILDQAPSAIVLFEREPEERIYANPSAQRLLGVASEAARGREPRGARVCYPDGVPMPFEQMSSSRALRGELVPPTEVLVRREDGEEVWLLEQAAPLRGEGGRVVGAVLVGEDIRSLKELERLRGEWTSVVAHDLRQPVAVISLSASMLAKRHGDERVGARIAGAARRLERMIGDLLTASLIDSHRLELVPRPIDYLALVREVVEQMSDGLPPGRIALHAQGGLDTLRADPERLQQVLVNLLGNAIKYGAGDRPIEVEVKVEPDEVVTSISNDGAGIPPDEVERVFTRHHRTRSSKHRGIPGLGLGLYIARSVVEAHGGSIAVTSTPGAKTTFSFTLPLTSAARGGRANAVA